jgi:hypothetical protein
MDLIPSEYGLARIRIRAIPPINMIGHSHTDRLRRIGEASFLEEGTMAIAPFVLKTMAGVHVPVAADFDFEGDFFYFCDNILDERSDLYY